MIQEGFLKYFIDTYNFVSIVTVFEIDTQYYKYVR